MKPPQISTPKNRKSMNEKKKKQRRGKKYKEQSSDAVHFRFSATGATLAMLDVRQSGRRRHSSRQMKS